MNNITIGKYLPLNSPFHKLDPRSKIIALFIMIIAIFVCDSWYLYGAMFLLEIVVLYLSKLKFSYILKTFKPMIFMMVFLMVINILSVKTGDLWCKFWIIEIYSDAVLDTLFIVVRLMLMITLTTILTATTKPVDLTLGLEYLFKPLKVFKFPYHEVAMMLSIALRFIPTILEETMRIMNAQKSRGVDYENGKLKEKITAILSLIVPLFSASFQRAYDLADAMDARGYIPGRERTRYRVLKYNIKDYLLLFACLIIMASTIIIRVI